jgi:hypothetical protein
MMTIEDKARDAFKRFLDEAAATESHPSEFLLALMKFTGHNSVPEMVRRFQELAGIKKK